jgi:dTDP-4-dehydrorhamnose reductase
MDRLRNLIIGASGQIGGSLLTLLPTAVGTFYTRPMPASCKLDIRDTAAVNELFDRLEPEKVFVTVLAPGGVDALEGNLSQAISLEVNGIANVILAAKKHGTKIIFVSTDYVFNGVNGPFYEDDEPEPLNTYGVSKLIAEILLRKEYPNSVIVRTTSVFDWSQTSKNFAMKVWSELSKGNHLKVPVDQLCNPTLSSYLALCMTTIAESNFTGVINIVGENRISRRLLAEMLAQAMNLDSDLLVPVTTEHLKQKAKRPLSAGLATGKMEAFIGPAMKLGEAMSLFRERFKNEAA